MNGVAQLLLELLFTPEVIKHLLGALGVGVVLVVGGGGNDNRLGAVLEELGGPGAQLGLVPIDLHPYTMGRHLGGEEPSRAIMEFHIVVATVERGVQEPLAFKGLTQLAPIIEPLLNGRNDLALGRFLIGISDQLFEILIREATLAPVAVVGVGHSVPPRLRPRRARPSSSRRSAPHGPRGVRSGPANRRPFPRS